MVIFNYIWDVGLFFTKKKDIIRTECCRFLHSTRFIPYDPVPLGVTEHAPLKAYAS